MLLSKGKEGMKEEEKTRIAKQFFDQFSKSENFDPLIPEYWYIITKSSAIKKVCFHSLVYFPLFCLALISGRKECVVVVFGVTFRSFIERLSRHWSQS